MDRALRVAAGLQAARGLPEAGISLTGQVLRTAQFLRVFRSLRAPLSLFPLEGSEQPKSFERPCSLERLGPASGSKSPIGTSPANRLTPPDRSSPLGGLSIRVGSRVIERSVMNGAPPRLVDVAVHTGEVCGASGRQQPRWGAERHGARVSGFAWDRKATRYNESCRASRADGGGRVSRYGEGGRVGRGRAAC
jgi:hypothetical protein